MKHYREDNQKNVNTYGSSRSGGRRYRDESQPKAPAYNTEAQRRARRYPDKQQHDFDQPAVRRSSAPRQNVYAQQDGYQDISRYAGRNVSRQPVQQTKKKQKKKAGPFVIVLRIFFILLLLFAGFMGIRQIMTYHKEDKAFDQLAAIVDKKEQSQPGVSKYQDLYDMNKDFYGWIEIDDTVIDYPVMYTPYDPEKYLHTDFEGNYSESGCLFIDADCQADGHHYIIYGHHMFNGSMFGNLPKYEKEEYYEDHKKVNFDTMTDEGVYEVFAAFYSKDYDKKETGVFKYYEYKTLKTEMDFNEFIYNVKQAAIYDTGITPVFGDDIITLSTCNYHTEDGRFVVCARKVKNPNLVTN